ncbi:MAG: hypothetical protein Q7S02_06605 [bacterium]|nr:hypothetical protein [bacterium]
MDAYVNGKKVHLDPKKSIGKGGEADVYDIGGGMALKAFKPPDHPDYDSLPIEQEGARRRLAEHQRKLRQFPGNLPPRVVTPSALATDKTGKAIVGYTMPLLTNVVPLRRYAERNFRSAGGVGNDVVLATFRDLHATVEGVHHGGIVIGDFNDLNILVRGTDAHLIDADSFQFGSFRTAMVTARFVDPTKCDPKTTSLMLVHPHDASSDWYAFAVMLFSAFCYVDPYGGVYLPKDPKRRVAHDARPLKRITVFHPDVRYPKPAAPFGVLPDDLLDYYHRLLERDERGTFPLMLLERMRWTRCTTCGTEHARAVCPTCATAAPAAIRSVTVIRGKVTATRIFRTSGTILHACVEDGILRWLHHEGDEFRREDRSVVIRGDLDPTVRFRIHGGSTLIGKGGQLVTVAPGAAPTPRVVDTFASRTVVATNGSHTYWVEDGRLTRDGDLGDVRIGDVLSMQTSIWVGERFGFGFYRAGTLSVGFVFDAERLGINDAVPLPPIRGQLVDATAVFSTTRCWFFLVTEDRGKTMHQVIVIRPDGSVEATAEAIAGDGSWLGTSIWGNAAVGAALLVATDDGVVRVEPDGSHGLVVTKTFPDTEPFVDANAALFVCKDGLAVVNRHEITVLKIA